MTGDDDTRVNGDRPAPLGSVRLDDYLPRKTSPRRRDLKWAVVLLAIAAAFQVQRLTLTGELTSEEMFWLQAVSVFPGVIGLGFLAAFALVRNGDDETE